MCRSWSKAAGWRAAHFVVLALALANGGCVAAVIGGAAAAGGVAGYAYYKGGLAKEFNGSLDTCWAAAKSSVQELGLPVVAEKREPEGGFLDCRTGDGQTVRIAFESLKVRIAAEGPRTDVSVRAGLLGDRHLSERILSQMAGHLEPPGAVATVPPGAPLVAVPQETPPPPLVPPHAGP
jgi:hypothetical protein